MRSARKYTDIFDHFYRKIELILTFSNFTQKTVFTRK